MMNYKVTYRMDGYRFYDVVEAENKEQAKEYLVWLESDFNVISAEETNEVATYYCPAGWIKPESRKQALIRSREMWLKNYFGNLYDGNLKETDEVKAFLIKDGWERTVVKDDDWGFETVVYKRGNQEIEIN